MPRSDRPHRAAFTLLELLTVIVIISILAVMTFGIVATIRFRAEKALCISNLKNLYTGAAAYVQQNGQWPQISTMNLTEDGSTYAQDWITALRPFGLSEPNWLCPAVGRMLRDKQDEDLTKTRVDYLATPFDGKPLTPFLWSRQPWFVERGAVHEGGNLMIWSNGQIVTLKEAMQYQ